MSQGGFQRLAGVFRSGRRPVSAPGGLKNNGNDGRKATWDGVSLSGRSFEIFPQQEAGPAPGHPAGNGEELLTLRQEQGSDALIPRHWPILH